MASKFKVGDIVIATQCFPRILIDPTSVYPGALVCIEDDCMITSLVDGQRWACSKVDSFILAEGITDLEKIIYNIP